jgi:hypothetical protein
MNEVTPYTNVSRTCWICDQEIVDLKKASTVEVGVGQELASHDICLQSLSDTLDAKEAEADAAEASLLAKAKEEVASGLMDWLVNDIGMKEVKQ